MNGWAALEGGPAGSVCHVAFDAWQEGHQLGHTNREIELERQEGFAAVPLCVLEHCADPAISLPYRTSTDMLYGS